MLKPHSHGLLRGGRESGGLVASAAILVSAGTPWTWVASPILSVKLIRGQTPVPTGGAEANPRPVRDSERLYGVAGLQVPQGYRT